MQGTALGRNSVVKQAKSLPSWTLHSNMGEKIVKQVNYIACQMVILQKKKKNKDRAKRLDCHATLCRSLREDLTGQWTFTKRSERSESTSCEAIWGISAGLR